MDMLTSSLSGFVFMAGLPAKEENCGCKKRSRDQGNHGDAHNDRYARVSFYAETFCEFLQAFAI